MNVLVLGGTQLTGPFLLRELVQLGHRVTAYHRNNHPENVPAGVEQIIPPREIGPDEDRYHLREFAERFRAVKADVVVHMIAFTKEDAEVFVRVFAGSAGRAVIASSSDVYRAMGIINRTEPGPPIPVPIDENGPLRLKLSLHGTRSEKRWVEQAVQAEPRLPATILRYPAIYGPGSFRRQDWIKRMLDNRPAIIISKGEAGFRFTHGYAQDVAHATALAATNDGAAGRIYNVGERDTPSERRRLEDFARIASWRGEIVEIADERMPGGDGFPWPGQDWLLDTTRIRNELDFSEISDYERGIRDTIDWQRTHVNPSLDSERFDYPAEDALLAARCGFSLIELLVVIGIIAVLIGLLMPTLSRVREQAKQVQCAAQLRQVGVALTNYTIANRGHYPLCSDWQVYGGDGTGEDTPGLGWCEELEPYIGKPGKGIYLCPAFPPETEINYFLSVKWAALRGPACVLASDVRRASEFVLGGECTHQRLYPPPWGDARLYLYTNDCDKDDQMWKCLSFFGEEYGRNAHRAGNNVLFGDGHVAPFRKFDPNYMTYDPQNPGVDWNQLTAQ